MSDPQMSLTEAVLAMLAMVIILCFVLFFYCVLPCYNNYKKHSWTREANNGEDWESDPRWNNDKYQFVPRKPTDYLTDKKYSRLGACSRTSSMRSNNPLLDGAQDLSSNPPVNLDVEASQPVIPPLSGKIKLTTDQKLAKLTKKPPKYSEIYKANDKTGSVGSTSSSSLSNPPEYTSKTPSVEKNLNQEEYPNNQAQPQANSNVVPAKPVPPKVKIMKPPKKNRKPPPSQNPSGTESKATECSTETQGEAT